MTNTARDRYRSWLATILGCALCLGCASAPDPTNDHHDPANGAGTAKTTDSPGRPNERQKAITAYRTHLERFPQSAEYDAITRRLADLLLDQASEQRLEGVSVGSQTDIQKRRIETSYQEAISAYEYLVRQSPGDTELLYQLSRAYEESGQPRQALDAIDQMLAQATVNGVYLQSDTLFRRGELLFDTDRFAQAEVAYRAVIGMGKNAPAYEQSLYKLGWSLYFQEKYAQALGPFFDYLQTRPGLVPGSQAQTADLTPVDQEQLADLSDVISRCFAYLDGVKTVEDYFGSREPVGYEKQVYLSLARWYEDKQQITQAAETLLALTLRTPLSGETLTWTGQALSLYQAAGFERLALDTRHQFVSAYGPRSAFWSTHEKSSFPDEMHLIKHSLRELGDYYHLQFIDAPEPDYAAAAESYYRDYLSWFAQAEQADRIRFQLAELLARQGRDTEAYAYYENVAWGQSQGPLAVEAALRLPQINEKLETAATPRDRRTLAARGREDAVRFIMTYPDQEAAPRLLARVGGELLDDEDTDALAGILDGVLGLDNGGRDELMLVAWTLKARVLDARKDYSGAVLAYRSALLCTTETDARRTALTDGLATALLAAGRQAAQLGNWNVAIGHFEEAAQMTDDDQLLGSARYANASVALELEDWRKAIALLNTYRRAHPDEPYQSAVSRKLAYAYEQNGEIDRAAQAYFELGQSNLQPEELRRQALRKAGRLFGQVGNNAMAIEAREYHVMQFPGPVATSAELMQELAALHAARGDASRQREWLVAIIELDGANGTATTRVSAARASLALGKHQLEQFHQVRLVHPLRTNLARKIAVMEKALAEFERTIDYGIASTSSAASYYMASMYDELGRALLASERPASLTDEERAQYEKLLAEQAAPFARRAMDMYARNASGADIDNSDPWVRRSVEQLHALQASQKQPGGV